MRSCEYGSGSATATAPLAAGEIHHTESKRVREPSRTRRGAVIQAACVFPPCSQLVETNQTNRTEPWRNRPVLR